MIFPKRKQSVCEAYAYIFCKLLKGISPLPIENGV